MGGGGWYCAHMCLNSTALQPEAAVSKGIPWTCTGGSQPCKLFLLGIVADIWSQFSPVLGNCLTFAIHDGCHVLFSS